jgi:response regulator RpfG family c-di-GMP phosphodiesterase
VSETRRIGKYEVQDLLGKGSVAQVYRGSDGQKAVALKFVNRNSVAEPGLARLRQAAASLTRVRHPAVATFIELIENEKVLCLVSELAEGEPLAARLKSARPDLRQTWEISRQVLEALEAAHAKGVVHGDLKPANIFIDAQGRVKITDFGSHGLVRGAQGTPEYMAPEQFGERGITARTDLYQVGAIVYELVAGRLPFTGTREEVIHRVQQERPDDPSSARDKIAWQLDWVIQRALSKDATVRFGSAREFLDGLRLGLQDSIGSPLAVPAAPAPEPAVPAPSPPSAPAAPKVSARTPEPALSQPAKTMALVAPAPAPAPANEAPHDDRIKVLFVDDEERILNGLRALFRQDYHVFTADNGAAALDLVQKNGIQVVVSDQRMPGMTGVELLRQVRKAAPKTVRLLLTGYSDLAALVGSINDGEIFRFVKKPWDNDEMRETMSDAAALAAKVAAAAAAPAKKVPPPRPPGSLLVIDAGEGLAKGLQRLVADSATVKQVSTAADAAKYLQQNDVAAIVADLDAGREGLVKLFKLLKEKRPDILSIVMSDDPDSELVAQLVNEAQIYRFLEKPINGRELAEHVSEALRRHSGKEPAGSGLAQDVAAARDRLVTRSA